MPGFFCPSLLAALFIAAMTQPSQEPIVDELAPGKIITVDWGKPIAESRTTPTLQVVVNPMLLRGARLHDPAFNELRSLGAEYVRYVPWLPYPRQAVAELESPSAGKTSWDFQYIDPTLEDFMKATGVHSVVMNFSTLPAWMYKTDAPVLYPADPNQVIWNYTQGTELRDPTMEEAAGYLARVLSWYEKGGFTDELGNWHSSGHHYKFAYWEVLNEIESEHKWTPEIYTRFYDEVVLAMRKVDPDIQFVGLALAHPNVNPNFFSYFLDPAHHKSGIPLDFISYHFYSQPTEGSTPESWQYTFFDQAEQFITVVRFAETYRKHLSPGTKTDLNEIGVILPEDGKEKVAGYIAKDEPPVYWNLNSAMYAYLFVELTKMGIDVLGESQLIGYKSQYPSVSMIDYKTGDPNARFWTLKLLKDNFKPGDKLMTTSLNRKNGDVAVQAFATQSAHKLLIINKRIRPAELTLPPEFARGRVSFVAPSTGEKSTGSSRLVGANIRLESGEVAVITAQ